MTGCPVIPIAQWGVQEILEPYGRRVHLVPRHTVHVLAGPPVGLPACTGGPPGAEQLRTATSAILDAITGLLVQLRGGQPPEQRWDPREHHGQARLGNFRRAPGSAA